MKTKKSQPDIIIYQAKNGAIELKGDYEKENIWATQAQIAEIFSVDRSVATKHIKNIFKDEELNQKSNVQFLHIPNSDKPVKFYSLDVILAVGYRTKSAVAIKFRQWANQTLKQHITKGFTINKSLLKKNYTLFEQALSDLQKLSQNTLSSDNVLELIKAFSQTWFSLDAYDRDQIKPKEQTLKSINFQSQQLNQNIQILKQELINKNEATELFAQEKSPGSLQGILASVFQSAFGEDIYPSLEAKASHLLYFIVKNHPFNDGNKRTGAFAFIWFLQQTNYPFRNKITPEALTAITLLIAVSSPKDKQKMTELVILLLSGK